LSMNILFLLSWYNLYLTMNHEKEDTAIVGIEEEVRLNI
jgi:hypothetical protein